MKWKRWARMILRLSGLINDRKCFTLQVTFSEAQPLRGFSVLPNDTSAFRLEEPWINNYALTLALY